MASDAAKNWWYALPTTNRFEMLKKHDMTLASDKAIQLMYLAESRITP